MKKQNCLICGKRASIQKEILIALSYLQGEFRSTNTTVDFCRQCFPHASPVFIIDDEE